MSNREPVANQREAILLSILINGEKYGLEIRDEYEKRTRKKLSLGSLYPTMETMVAKGYVRSRRGSETHERGGNARRYYSVTAGGHRAMNAAQVMSNAAFGQGD